MDDIFKSYMLNQNGIDANNAIASDFDYLLCALEDRLGPEGIKTREFSIVKTKLEEAAFFAKKANAKKATSQV